MDKSLQGAFPYDLKNLSESGVTEEDRELFKLGSPQEVSIEKGVFFTQGQHKGIMLKILLHRSSQVFKNVVFVDDRSHHVSGVRAVFKTQPQKMFSYQYVRSKEWIDQFNNSTKEEVQRAWCLFSRGIVEVLFATDRNLIFNPCVF